MLPKKDVRILYFNSIKTTLTSIGSVTRLRTIFGLRCFVAWLGEIIFGKVSFPRTDDVSSERFRFNGVDSSDEVVRVVEHDIPNDNSKKESMDN